MVSALKQFTLLCVVIGVSVHSQAGVITSTALFGFSDRQQVNIVTGPSNAPATSDTRSGRRIFQGFSSSIGILTGVDITFTSSYSFETIVQSSNFNASGNVNTYGRSTGRMQMLFSVLNSSVPLSSGNSVVGNVECSANSNQSTSASCSDSIVTAGSFNGSINTSSAPLSLFIDGPVSVDVYQTVVADAFTNLHGNYVVSVNDNNSFSGEIQVTYTYDEHPVPVPVPSPLLIVAAGFGWLILRRLTQAS